MRLLTDNEIAEILPEAKKSGTQLDTCPTCGSQLEEKPWGWDRTPGQYKFAGEAFDCDCDAQILLRKHYLLAHIPDQYMKLDWDRDFKGQDDIRKYVTLYLSNWPGAKANGMGIEFGGSQLGIGKTFAATHIGKELIKRDESVYFISFREMLPRLKEHNGARAKLFESNVLILDEVVEPYYERQQGLYADFFEDLIRHRTNYNSVTIMTTNLSDERVSECYPRVYSLLRAKQWRINLAGSDVRKDWIENQNVELFMSGEIQPIT